MNSNESRIRELLQAIIELLDQYNSPQWVKRFREIRRQIDSEQPHEVRAEIRGVYGGMGSFNDIVLMTSDGRLPVGANQQLDKMRSELYQLIQS